MSTIVTRSGKGSPLTNLEIDSNWNALNTDKAELSGAAFTGAITTNSTFDGRDVAVDGAKLDGIEVAADVTDAANVTAAGALMDSEVTNLAEVKAFSSSDYATAAQGTTADAALPKSGGTMTGALVLNNTGSVKVSAGTTAQRESSPSAGMFRFNSTEGKFEGYTTEWGEIGGGAADLLLNQFTGDGSDVTFTLSGAAVENNTLVYLDGVYQSKSNYTVSNADPAVVTFSSAPANGTAIEIMVAAIAVTNIGTPADNTVTTAKIANNAVTAAKIADDAVGADQLASNAVVTASIVDANVTTAKIADDAVTAAKIASVPISVGITTVVTSASMTATVNTHVYVSAAGRTITLPASPTIGQRVLVTVGNFTDTVVGRNGSNIMSSATDFTMDAAYLSIQFIYTDATQGWVMS